MKVRVYIENGFDSVVVDKAVELGFLDSYNVFEGMGRCQEIRDCEFWDVWIVGFLLGNGIRVFPLDHYELYRLSCEDGSEVEDDMIIRSYDEHVLSGYNLLRGGEYLRAVVGLV